MSEFIRAYKNDDANTIVICLDVEEDKVLAIGEKLNELNEDAYMNGYNWEILLNYHLGNTEPELLEGLETDPEAGAFYAYYEQNPSNEKKSQRFVEIVKDLIENESKLYKIIEVEGKLIPWD